MGSGSYYRARTRTYRFRKVADNVQLITRMKFQNILMTGCKDMGKKLKKHYLCASQIKQPNLKQHTPNCRSSTYILNLLLCNLTFKKWYGTIVKAYDKGHHSWRKSNKRTQLLGWLVGLLIGIFVGWLCYANCNLNFV